MNCLTDDPQLSENIFIRFPNLEDFKKSILNCKPTVPSTAVDMYHKFLDTYGHKDQKDDLLAHGEKDKPFLSYYA
jgi:hypothetical protein